MSPWCPLSSAIQISATSSSRPLVTTTPKLSYKSDIHPDQLYTGTSAQDRFRAPSDLVQDCDVGFNGYIPIQELDIKCTTGSSGPGGQNVNKSATKVEVRFNMEKATWLKADVKEILKAKWSNQLTKEGDYFVKSDRTRSQMLNQADCLAKLRHAISKAVEEQRTRLEEQQLSEEEEEKRRKNAIRAANLRLKEKRNKSMNRQLRKDKNPLNL